MKRTHRVLLLAGLISGAFTAGVYAENVLQRVDAYLRPDFNIVVDGKPVTLESAPLVYQDKSYLPLAELSKRLGASIYWKGESKTIYINSRINDEQQQEDGSQTFELLELTNPQSTIVEYLGAKYPVLLTYNSKASGSHGLYYREKDVRRMGIDTNGLAKAKDRLTEETFVPEKELQQRWRQRPTQTYASGYEAYVIADEPHPEKLSMLRSHIKGMATRKFQDVEYTTKPIMVEKLKDKTDAYRFLYYETVRIQNQVPVSKYVEAEVKLTQDPLKPDHYTVNITSTKDLNYEADRREVGS
ncbi:stalk domain-containing protein [Paenibacillus sp. YYML68]|uniref:stalk domain-containing protein n=1 Tax=Paenibacillus sp. YYML68 TaxID=2909250 RepID=UPI0024904E89|nr:stalk domain-containing protein [Paenibacillus sp. YYML68]